MAGNFTVNIDTKKVRETAGEIERLNTSLNDKLTEIYKTMDRTEESWNSDTGRTIREAMQGLTTTSFKRYNEIVNEYVTFLRNTAESYDSNELALNSSAAQFK